MAYAIMRAAKLSSMGSVAASLQHCYRERETPNADKSLTPDNQHIGAKSTDEAMGKLRALLPEKRRKDAVLAVEYVMTASPEWFANATPAQEKDFFERSLKWLANKYGADRIVTATIHRDEATPHLSAFLVPLTTDGRLCAKEFIGSRDKMRADQSSYAAAVESLGLQRGIEGSKAKHQTIREYYAQVQAANKTPLPIITADELKPQGFKEGLFGKLGINTHKETLEGVAQRLTAKIDRSTKAYRAAASEVSKARQEALDLRRAMDDQQNALKPFLEALRPLRKAERAVLAERMAAESAKMVQERETKERQLRFERQRQRADRVSDRDIF